MAAITDLATASSVANTDLLVVNQSGTDRKATALVVGTGLGISHYDSKFTQLLTHEYQVADDAVWLTPDKFFGFMFVAESAWGNYALVMLLGALNTATSIAKSSGVTVGSDPDGSLNVYYDGGNARYAIRNRLGSLTGIRVILVNMAAS
jgi:hypothetical protein